MVASKEQDVSSQSGIWGNFSFNVVPHGDPLTVIRAKRGWRARGSTNGVVDVEFSLLDPHGATISKGTLRGVDPQRLDRKFLVSLLPEAKPILKENRPRPSEDALDGTLASPVLNGIPFELGGLEDFMVEPTNLEKALNRIVKSGAKFNQSIRQFIRTYDHYSHEQREKRDPVVTAIVLAKDSKVIRNKKITRRSRVDSLMGENKGVSAPVCWIDVDIDLPQGSLSENHMEKILEPLLPKKILAEKYKYLQLRGLTIDPDDADFVVRRKIIFFVGENYLITVRSGKVDALDSRSAPDTMQVYREIMEGKRKPHMDLLCSESQSGANPSPGKMFLDFVACLLHRQEGLIKQYDRRLTGAQYDAEHKTPRRLRVKVDPEDSLTALSYMKRKFEESKAKLAEVMLAQRSIKNIFGGADEGSSNPDVKAFVEHLENAIDRILNFIPTSEQKVNFLSQFAGAEMAKERELRNYLMTVAGTLILPTFGSIELAQVPLKIIERNADKILNAGGVLSCVLTLAFVAYDRYRRWKNPSL